VCKLRADVGRVQKSVSSVHVLFVAGNRNAVLSLWPVYDEGTAEFMRRFFARVRAGQPHADALATTKRELAATRRYGDPSHWAGFVLYGD